MYNDPCDYIDPSGLKPPLTTIDLFLVKATPAALTVSCNEIRQWNYDAGPILMGRRAALEIQRLLPRWESHSRDLETLVWEGWDVVVDPIAYNGGSMDHRGYCTGIVLVRLDVDLDPRMAWVVPATRDPGWDDAVASHMSHFYARALWTFPHDYIEPSFRLDAILAERGRFLAVEAEREQARAKIKERECCLPPSPVMTTAYTVGNRSSYDRMLNDKPTSKMGQRLNEDPPYMGGWVWRSQVEAERFLSVTVLTFKAAVYGLILPNGWDHDVSAEPADDGVHRLLNDALLFKV